MSISDVLAVVVVFTMAPAAVLYPILYSRLPWQRSLIGRALMTYSAGMALLIVHGLLATFGVVYPGQAWVQDGIYGVIDVGMNLLVLSLFRKPKAARAEAEALQAASD